MDSCRSNSSVEFSMARRQLRDEPAHTHVSKLRSKEIRSCRKTYFANWHCGLPVRAMFN
jgi:hypothetical protein